MSGEEETSKETSKETPKTDSEGISVAKVRDMIGEAIANLTNTKTTVSKGSETDIATQVREEVANVKRKESEAQQRKTLEDRLAALEGSGKEETAPKKVRVIERIMGWVDDD